MKAKPYHWNGRSYVPCDAIDATHVQLAMPGPIMYRMIPVQGHGTRQGTGNWTWNGDTEKPTLRPSILTSDGERGTRCHSWVTDGNVQFLDDCTHELKGQTLPLLESD
jgi:hypothetical protein